MVAYDLNSGKELWHKAFKVKDEFKTGGELSVARAGEIVIVTTDTEQKALKVADGTTAWDVKKVVPSGCESGTYTGGTNLIRTTSCLEGGDEFTGEWSTEAALVDPATGKPEWSKRFGENEAEMALSTSPLVLSGEKGVFALDEKSGERRAKIPGMTEKYYINTEEDGSPMRQAAGFGNILLMGVGERDSADRESNTLVAYDLDTGKELWKAPTGNTIHYIPLRDTGSERLLAYVNEGAEKPKLVEFNPKDGAMTTVAEYPEEVNKNMSGGEWPFWHDGVLYVTSVGASVSGDSYALVALPTTAP